MVDALRVCRSVAHYVRKNGYSPLRVHLDCTEQEIDELIVSGVLERARLYPGGAPVLVRLTAKGEMLAAARAP